MTGGADRPIGPSAPIAVVGAGTMGAGIAQVAAVAGHPVLIYDVAEGAAGRAVRGIRERIVGLVARGRLDTGQAALQLATASGLEELTPARCVIEAVAEDLAVKQGLFAQLEKIVTQTACWPRTPRHCRRRPSRPACATPDGWSGCISSTRRR